MKMAIHTPGKCIMKAPTLIPVDVHSLPMMRMATIGLSCPPPVSTSSSPSGLGDTATVAAMTPTEDILLCMCRPPTTMSAASFK